MALDPESLGRASAFAALPQDARRALALCFHGRQYAAREVVFCEGEPASCLLFIAEGELVVSARARGGGTRQLLHIGSGQLVGESALIDPTPRQAALTSDILQRNAPAAARSPAPPLRAWDAGCGSSSSGCDPEGLSALP